MQPFCVSLVCLLALLFPSSNLRAVDCTPDTITLTSQTEVDDFQANHGPGCDRIVSGLTISGASITDLTPLSGLTSAGFGSTVSISGTSVSSLSGLDNLASVYWLALNNNASLTSLAALSSLVAVSGPFVINGNTALTNLDGLEGLTALTGGALFIENNTQLADLSALANLGSIAASLVVTNNDSLLSLDDLSGLSHVASNISITYNDALTDIGGLGGLVGFDETLNLRYNNQLASLGDLTNITELGGLVIWSNPALGNLDGLANLTMLGNNTSLSIRYNNTLNSIAALSNVVGAGFDVELTDNPLLSDCSALQTLLDDVDDADPGPGPGDAGIPDVGGEVTVADNQDGCNSLAEILFGTNIGADLNIDAQPNLVNLLAGDTQQFDLIAFNAGPEAATNVEINVLFAGPVVPEALPPECGFDANQGRMLCLLAELPASAGDVLQPQFRFPDGGDQTLQVNISADQADPNPGDNSDTVPIFVQGAGGANLAAASAVLEGANAFQQVLVGTELTISAAAANAGPNPATGVEVEITLPAEWSFTMSDPSCSESMPANMPVLTCPLPDLPAPPLPAIPTSELTLFKAIAMTAGEISVVATANESDPAPGNNTFQLPVDVRFFSADLRVEESSFSEENYLLDDSEFFVRFVTRATDAELAVTPILTFQLSPAEHVTESSVVDPGGVCVKETLGSIIQWQCQADISSKYWYGTPRVKFRVDQPGDYEVSARMIDDEAYDTDPSNNEVETVFTVVPPPPVRVRAIEVNQVVQDWENSVPLFQGKDTLVRVFMEDDENLLDHATGHLIATSGGPPLAGSPLSPVNGSLLVRPDATSLRQYVSGSLNFLLPDNWTAVDDLELAFVLEANGRDAQCAEPDGQADCMVTLSLTEPALPELDIIGAGYTTDDVQWLIFDCGDPCVEDAANENDPPVIHPEGTFRLDVGGDITPAIDIVDLLAGREGARATLMEDALLATQAFDDGDIVVRRLRSRSLDADEVGWRISIRKQRDWATLFVDASELEGATPSISEKQRGGVYQRAPNLPELFEQAARLRTTLPLASIDVRFLYLQDFGFKPTTYRDINPELDLYRLLQDSQCPLCRTDAMRVGGYLLGGGVEGSGGNAMNRVYSSYIGGSPGINDYGYSRNTGPHEFAHSFGKEHAVAQLNDDGDGTIGLCGAVASETALIHPYLEEIPGRLNDKLELTEDYSDNTFPALGPMTLGTDKEVWGLDSRFISGGMSNQIVSPLNSVDAMSYCLMNDTPPGELARKWMSKFSYDQIAFGLATGAVGTPDDEGQVGDIVYVAGNIDASGSVEIGIVTGGHGPMPDQEPGELIVSLVDNSGTIMSSVSVPLQMTDTPSDLIGDGTPEPPLPATFVAALEVPGPDAVALVIGNVAEPLARIDASPNAPTVDIITPTSMTPLPDPELVIEWAADDLDGDALRATVYFSPNDGVTWTILGMNVAAESMIVPAGRLSRAESARIKVSVSDGFHFAEAVSEPFTVGNTLPQVAITSPAIRNDLVETTTVHRFHSIAWDNEDGNLGNASAVWSSDRDGMLGSGVSVDVATAELSPGCHQISVTYTDSDGGMGAAIQQACVQELILKDGFE